MRLKRVMQSDGKKLRLCRLMRDVGNVGDGNGYSEKLTLSLACRLLGWSSDWHEWRLTLLGVEVHYKRSYGGRFV